MENRAAKAIENHNKGYNCAQSVACAYCDAAGMDEETMFKVMEGFGLGMGGTYGTCGAVTGAIAVLSMRNSSGNLETPDSKGGAYKIVREVTEEFIEKNDSLVCRELKGIDTGRLLRSCPGCIEDAAEILAEILTKQGA